MKKREPRQNYSGEGIALQLVYSVYEHVTFYAGVAESERRGEAFKRLRQINMIKAANARMTRPHKTG